MDQLKAAGVIEHRIASVIVDLYSDKSSIKFGSWDEDVLAKDTSLRVTSVSE
jgi:hypothetical protein